MTDNKNPDTYLLRRRLLPRRLLLNTRKAPDLRSGAFPYRGAAGN